MKNFKIRRRNYSKHIFKGMLIERTAVVMLALAVFVAGCKKFEPMEQPNAGSGDASYMSDLVVSDNFDWKLFQTLDILVDLPAEEEIKPIKVTSLDGRKVYFKGFSEDGTRSVKTKVTIPSYVDLVLIQFDDGSSYEPAIVPVMNNMVTFNFNTMLKAGGGGDECCDGKVTWLTLRYLGSEAIYVEVNGHGPGNSGLYTGNIVQNQEFSIYGNDNHNTLGSKVKIYKNNTNDKTEIHTSCSVDIFTGQTWSGNAGDFFIVAGESRHAGPLCPMPNGDDDDDDDFSGSLAYEDLWPSKGDYDFNDLVIDYNFDITKNGSEQIEHITATFKIYAFGAAFHNGFGFTLPNVAPNQIISVQGSNLGTGTYISLAGNGTEQGQSQATFIAYDNAYRIMPHPGNGIGVNTEHSAPYVTPETIVLEIDFYEGGSFGPGGPVTWSQLDIGNFNPFLIINQDRSNEVHLPHYPPTDLANTGMFGIHDDDTDPGSNRYYVTTNNLPWAINIPETFDHPIEKQDINGAYYKFSEWAESGGTLFPDWYQNIAGYRNASLIY